MIGQEHLLILGLMVALAAFTQGFTGLGFGIIVLALAAFTPTDLERASVVINLVLIPLNATIVLMGRKHSRINWRLVEFIILGEVVGVPLGYWFILVFGQRPIFRLALGLVLAAFAANELFRPRLRKGLNMAYGVLAGVVGGFLGGGFTASGPPLALFVYSWHEKPADAKGTLQLVFATATLWRLANVVMFGKGITPPVLRSAAAALPIAILLASAGLLLARRVSTGTFLKIVFSFIGLAGVMNIIKGLT